MGDDHNCEVVEIGSVCLKLEDNREILLRKVRHVPKLRRNLILMSMLADQDCYFIGNKKNLQIRRVGKTIVTGARMNGLYYLKSVSFPNVAFLSQFDKTEDFERWNRSLSHISENGLNELSKQWLIQSIGIMRLNFCEHCVYSKAKRLKFTKETHISKDRLNYIHTDLWDQLELLLGVILGIFYP